MRNASQALIACGWKAGFRRRSSNGDTARMPASFRKAAPMACLNDSAILVALRYRSLWPTSLLRQSRGRRKSSSIACGERHGRKRLESLQVLSETRGGRTRSANAARACATAGLQSSLAGHMWSRRPEISGSGDSYYRRASLSTPFAWARSRQHTQAGRTHALRGTVKSSHDFFQEARTKL